jgi:hypothetical protein
VAVIGTTKQLRRNTYRPGMAHVLARMNRLGVCFASVGIALPSGTIKSTPQAFPLSLRGPSM